MKSKLSQSPRTRNILTFSWRILAASTLFLIFFLVKKIGLKVMAYNPYLQNVAGFWSAEKFLRVIFCLSFFSYFSLAGIFTMHDRPYRRRYLSIEDGRSRLGTKCRVILYGSEFWVEAATLSLWILLGASDIFFFDLVLGFFAEYTFLRAHLLTAAIMLPSLMFLTFLTHFAALGWWERKQEKGDASLRILIIAFLKQLIFTCVMYLAAAWALTALYPAVDTFGKVIQMQPMLFLIPLCLVLIGLLSYRYLRALSARRRFFRKLAQICREERLEMSKPSHPYSSVFVPKDGISFRIFTAKGAYACKLICSTRRKTPLFFDEDGYASYDIAYGLFGLDFFTDTISARYTFETNDKKLLIISPEVDNVYVTDGKAKRRLESGDRFMEYLLYDGEGFLNAVRRKVL